MITNAKETPTPRITTTGTPASMSFVIGGGLFAGAEAGDKGILCTLTCAEELSQRLTTELSFPVVDLPEIVRRRAAALFTLRANAVIAAHRRIRAVVRVHFEQVLHHPPPGGAPVVEPQVPVGLESHVLSRLRRG
ncbi:hypothetical protein ACMD2_17473 [Ananas comosus]|uniref:Uncharacterized protein n=1 Tax=Ananas comosus TaxID=4615 RepID=A0A199VXB9_ANACO|nr:hypothetical protein ACMD2_17473 [Ananas comosus]